jgi:tetratricopeptide (TPR) repeat protein
LRSALRIKRKRFGPASPTIADACLNLAVLLDDGRKFGEAEPLFEEALRIYAASLGDTHWMLGGARSHYAGHLIAIGEFEKAESMLLSAYSNLRATSNENHRGARLARARLVAVYEAMGDEKKAKRYRDSVDSREPAQDQRNTTQAP